MAPKKAATKSKSEPAEKKSESNGTNTENHSTPKTNSSKKRKAPRTEANGPAKAPRRSGRGASKPQPSEQQLLNYMLSSGAEELCRPEDESKDIQARGSSIRTYSSSIFNPFEELLCAVILSRPISHRLGLRSIRTVMNEPYNFTSAKAVRDAGKEKHHQALWDARTQHKGKTAEQIGMIADVVMENFTTDGDREGAELGKVLDSGNVDSVLEEMKDKIKGLGNTGLNIFLRRVQWLWPAGYPYVDARTGQSLRRLGLAEEAEELRKVLESNWTKLDTERVAGDDEGTKQRRAFVTVLERAIGAELEGKADDIMVEAGGP